GHEARSFLFSFIDQLNFSSDGWNDSHKITQTDGGFFISRQYGPALGRAQQILIGGDAHTGTHATFSIYIFAFPSLKTDLLQYVHGDSGNMDLPGLSLVQFCLLLGNLFSYFNSFGVMGKNLRTDPVLERGHDTSPIGIIL